jgi:hypothetical protein
LQLRTGLRKVVGMHQVEERSAGERAWHPAKQLAPSRVTAQDAAVEPGDHQRLRGDREKMLALLTPASIDAGRAPDQPGWLFLLLIHLNGVCIRQLACNEHPRDARP